MSPVALESERLSLRVAEERDAPAIAAYYAGNRAHFSRWDPHRPEIFYTASFWRERAALDRQAALADLSYRLFVFSRVEPDRVVGHASFANVVRGAFHCCHLGFGVDRDHEGRGYMREALEVALDWAFGTLLLHRVEANHRPENTRSAGLLERLDFVPQGYARDYLLIDGEWRDHVLTALINPRWRSPG